ncbi:MAG: PqiC family protein [Smithellaceae bacterium]|nr:membrane integrity-associated transporter subunit PqiC [Syntrophaceae bacterium]MDD4241396.1 PqiC family protein [Smithellaceae bacterium]NLX51070.1 membrane integrity-associated transporter subunit PqiC [Deltaproteobacteria bacterium]
MKRSVILVLFALAVLTAGCAVKATHFYTLGPAALYSAAAPVPFAVSVGPVTVPAVVDRPQMVLNTGANRVFLAEFDRWASPLKSEIARVVAENLTALLGTRQVTVFPRMTAAEASYRVVIDVLRFESVLGRAATLDAVWRVTSAKNGSSQDGRTTLTEAAPDAGYDALAAAHSRALGKLSAEIAAAIREMGR